MPKPVNASRTSSSLNGLMMAITIFIWFPILVVRGHAASPDRQPNTSWIVRLTPRNQKPCQFRKKPATY
jgi:hypothetical protein